MMKKQLIFLLILTIVMSINVTAFSEEAISELEAASDDLAVAQKQLMTNRQLMEESVYLVTDSTVMPEQADQVKQPKTVMPEQALEMVTGELVSAELIEKEDTVVYRIETLEKRKFLGLISAKVKVTTYIDFYTSEIVKEYPWYKFMFKQV